MTATCRTRRRSASDVRARGAAVLGDDREDLPGLLQEPADPERADAVRRALGLRPVHRRRAIPAGGLFTGAEGLKTPEQAAIFGGTAASSSTRATTSVATTSSTTATGRWTINSDAAAHALITLAQMKIPDRGPTTPAAPTLQRRAVAASPNGLPIAERLVDQ